MFDKYVFFYRRFQIGFVLFLLSVVYAMYVYFDLYGGSMRLYIAAKEKTSIKKQEVVQLMNLLSQEGVYSKTAEIVGEFEKKLSHDTRQSRISGKIYSIAKKTNVVIKGEISERVKRKSNLVSVMYSIQMSGDYRSVRRFVSLIRSMNIVVEIDEVFLKKNNKSGVDGNLVIVTYAYPEHN